MEEVIRAREDLIDFYEKKLDSCSKRTFELYKLLVDLKKENADLREAIRKKKVV